MFYPSSASNSEYTNVVTNHYLILLDNLGNKCNLKKRYVLILHISKKLKLYKSTTFEYKVYI